MTALLLSLTVRGALMFALVALLDRQFGPRTRAASRRAAWLLVPAAFLFLVPLPILHSPKPAPIGKVNAVAPTGSAADNLPANRSSAASSISWLALLWASGAAGYLLLITARTRAALRRWSRERGCVDPRLLATLEDCKAEAGVTAPIGLVVSDSIPAPMILGWLRPRILLPAALAAETSPEQLRAVLLHELAHFRALDLPLNWLFTAVCALHWFNPAAHLAFRSWGRFCEEAADEAAIRWLRPPTATAYGETLLRVLRYAHAPAPAPCAALAIVESFQHLTTRLIMIKQHEAKSPRYLVTTAVLGLLALGVFLHPVRAAEPTTPAASNDPKATTDDPKAVANDFGVAWLQGIDDGKYEQSWKDASPSFQKAITAKGWTDALTKVRTPLGKCKARKLASASLQTNVPSPSGPVEGSFVVFQFDTSFDGLAYAVETVTFEKIADNRWKASGYYIKPRP